MMDDRAPDVEAKDWYLQCPKCLALSGGDWSQCARKCPVASSPHFDQATKEAFGPLKQVQL